MEKRPSSQTGQRPSHSDKGWRQNSADKQSMTSRPPSTGPKPKK